MKKIFGFCLALLMGLTAARADEGMWLLKLMKQQHLEDSLRKAGLQLPPEALYSETSPSLRECVGIFGGGCTGEVVSADGLVLTNNHCGFSYVHAMSTMDKNYLKDGYFAKSRAEELPTPDLTFTFVLRIVDVTDDVNQAARKEKADVYTAQSQSFLEPLAEKLLKKSDLRKKKGIRVRIVPYFGGNQFYMFYEQVYSDVRLVVNPPYNIGQFGGNTDNWMWPRQNADFAMFRIYADKDGQPAPYSKDNVPLKVRKYLPISLKGIQQGDYAMIMGFPGSTSRYLTASEVKLRTVQNAAHVLPGNPQLDFMKRQMDANDSIRLQLEDDYFGLGNVVKNYGGMNESVEKTGLMQKKQAEEAAFRTFAAKSGDPAYATIIDRIDSLCKAYEDTIFDMHLYLSTLMEQKFQVSLSVMSTFADALEEGKEKGIEAARAALEAAYEAGAGHYDRQIDLQTMQLLLPYWTKHNRLGMQPAFLQKGDGQAYYADLYAKTLFRDRASFDAFMKNPSAEVLRNDPLYKHEAELLKFYMMKVIPAIMRYSVRRRELDKIYVRGLCEMYDWTKAPDANFTLRMTYGHVCDLKPRDGVLYDWRTTLTGMFEKASTTESDYFVNEDLRKFYERKDYGRYAREDGELPTCFLTNNDITGGNSGSPVMNAKGELIGLAFDGNIESLSSDLKFNPALQRCINVDIRYVLFIIDKFGGSTYVLDELDLR